MLLRLRLSRNLMFVGFEAVVALANDCDEIKREAASASLLEVTVKALQTNDFP